MKKDINNLEEIVNLAKEEIENNDENITAILDLEDLKSLKNLLTRYKDLEQIEQSHKKENGELRERVKELENSLVDMVNQFAYEDNNPKTKGSSLEKLYTGGLSALENAFNTLNIDEGIKREELWKLLEE